MIEVAPDTVVVYSDIACPWATLTVHRLRAARDRHGAPFAIDHRCFPLELFNERATPKRVLDAETPVAGALAPAFGWRMWQRRDSDWPITTLLPLEAVQAAKAQSLRASEDLDYALRRGLFAESRTISLHHVVLEIAEQCASLDVDSLAEALQDGRARGLIFEHKAEAEREGVKGSPHLFFPDGSDVHNPGVTMHWEGEPGTGFPVVDHDSPSLYDTLMTRATGG